MIEPRCRSTNKATLVLSTALEDEANTEFVDAPIWAERSVKEGTRAKYVFKRTLAIWRVR